MFVSAPSVQFRRVAASALSEMRACARARGNLQFAAYTCGISGMCALMADEWLDIRKWKWVNYAVIPAPCSAAHAVPSEPMHLSLRCRRRPPPIGCMEWPAGRVLLQWALDEGRLDRDDAGVVVEVGAGIGLTAIGLAAARMRQGNTQPVYATDACDETLTLLSENASAMGLANLRVAKWDAASGKAALDTLPCPVQEIDHIVGADVVYHGFGSATDASGRGLEHTLAALFDQKPDLRVSMLVIDRFSGGAVAALSNVAGVNTSMPSTTADPAVTAFLTTLHDVGLHVSTKPLPEETIASVKHSQTWLARAIWWLCGHYDGMTIVTISKSTEESRVHRTGCVPKPVPC